MTDKTLEELQTENLALLEKNRELLAELKKARGKARELEEKAGDGNEELETLRQEVRELKLHKPVRELLSGILVAPKYSMQEILDVYDFDLGEDGQIVMLNKDGSPVTRLPDQEPKSAADPKVVPVAFTEDEVWEHLKSVGDFDHIVIGTKASGGGASGSTRGGGENSPVVEKEPAEKEKASFGLR